MLTTQAVYIKHLFCPQVLPKIPVKTCEDLMYLSLKYSIFSSGPQSSTLRVEEHTHYFDFYLVPKLTLN